MTLLPSQRRLLSHPEVSLIRPLRPEAARPGDRWRITGAFEHCGPCRTKHDPEDDRRGLEVLHACDRVTTGRARLTRFSNLDRREVIPARGSRERRARGGFADRSRSPPTGIHGAPPEGVRRAGWRSRRHGCTSWVARGQEVPRHQEGIVDTKPLENKRRVRDSRSGLPQVLAAAALVTPSLCSAVT